MMTRTTFLNMPSAANINRVAALVKDVHATPPGEALQSIPRASWTGFKVSQERVHLCDDLRKHHKAPSSGNLP